MQFDFLEDKEEMHAFALSVVVIVLTVLAVLSLAISGSSIIFYILVIAAILFGFYMAYLLSKTPKRSQSASRQAKKRTRGK
jgi:threonine/homoserine/homoserine lactone efflux protein